MAQGGAPLITFSTNEAEACTLGRPDRTRPDQNQSKTGSIRKSPRPDSHPEPGGLWSTQNQEASASGPPRTRRPQVHPEPGGLWSTQNQEASGPPRTRRPLVHPEPGGLRSTQNQQPAAGSHLTDRTQVFVFGHHCAYQEISIEIVNITNKNH